MSTDFAYTKPATLNGRLFMQRNYYLTLIFDCVIKTYCILHTVYTLHTVYDYLQAIPIIIIIIIIIIIFVHSDIFKHFNAKDPQIQ